MNKKGGNVGKNFTQIQNEIIRTDKLDVYQKSCINNILSNDNEFRIAFSALSKRIPCSKVKCINTINLLKELNIISVNKVKTLNGDWDSNCYKVNLNELLEYIGVVHEKNNGSTYDIPQIVHEKNNRSTYNIQQVVHEKYNKNTKENIKENTKENTNLENDSSSDFNILSYAEERNFILSPIQIQQIKEDINVYSLKEVKQAFTIADNNGKRTYSYVRGILQRRRSEGDKNKKVNDEWEEMKKAAANGEDPF